MPPIGPRSLHLLHLKIEEFLQRPQHLLILEPLQYGLKAVGMLHQRPQVLWLELCPGPVADDVPGVSHGVPAKIGQQFPTRLRKISKTNSVTNKSNPNFEKPHSVTLVSTLQDFGVAKIYEFNNGLSSFVIPLCGTFRMRPLRQRRLSASNASTKSPSLNCEMRKSVTSTGS